MTIDISKYLKIDIPPIIFENLDAWITRTYEGCHIDWDALSREQRIWIISAVYEGYHAGARRTVDTINKGEERKVRDAQNRAIKQIMKGYK